MKQDNTDKRIKDAKADPFYNVLITYLQMNPMDAITIDPRPVAGSEEAKMQGEVWERWQAYLSRTGRKRTLKVWLSILASGNHLTLPCAEPMRIDANYQREFGPRNRYWDK